jgi:hypothetical protein
MRSSLAWMLVSWLGLQVEARTLLPQPALEEFSCASFPADLSETNLINRYGTGNVKRAPVVGSDDGPQAGTVVFDDSPRKLEMVWWDPEVRTRLAWVKSREANSPWKTPNGIFPGMDLLAIKRLNGWPFRLRGLTGPEGLGVIRSWGQGRLRDAGTDGCRLLISLQPRPLDRSRSVPPGGYWKRFFLWPPRNAVDQSPCDFVDRGS